MPFPCPEGVLYPSSVNPRVGEVFFFSKREVQAFIKFLFKHFPEITQEDAFSVPFWGKAGKYIYLEQVKGNYKAGKFNVLFDPVLK